MLESLIDRLTRASLRLRWLVIALSLLALVGGALALTQLKQELIPPIEFPQSVVLAFHPDLGVDEMLDQVTLPLEATVSGVEGVVNVESTTSPGVSVVVARNEFGLDQAALRADIRGALDQLELPAEMDPPELIAFGLSDLPIAFISVSSSQLALDELKTLVADEIAPSLLEIADVADVQVTGGQVLPEQIAESPQAAPTAPAVDPTSAPGSAGVPLPQQWIDLAAAQGVTLHTTDDLTGELAAAAVQAAPQLLNDLTPEMILAAPQEVIEAIPAELIAGLSEQQQSAFAERGASPEPGAEPVDEQPGDEQTGSELPASWQAAGQSQGIELDTPDDITPEIMQGISQFAPQMLEELTPDNLRGLSPEVLGWLPVEFVAGLDPELAGELETLAEPVGGLSALVAAEATETPTDAPELGGAWQQPPEDDPEAEPRFQTAADLMDSGFAADAAGFLNLYLSSGNPTAPQLISDLTPEVIAWLQDNEPGFLQNLDPGVLRLFSTEVLQQLPEDFWAGLEPDFRAELAAIAAGELEVFTPTATINRVNGNPSLALLIVKTSEGNIVATSHEVFDRLEELEADYGGLRFDVVFEQASFIEESINGVAREGGLGAIFAVVVILLFLSGLVNGKYTLSWRSTLVTAVSIPLSVFMAFAAMRWLPPLLDPLLSALAESTDGVPVLGAATVALHRLFPVGITLNIMTLSGMTVAVGRVVDDSIVVLENIFRHIQRGDDQRSSVLNGTRDVAIAILASTVTTVVVFLPIGLLGGLVGEFFLPFGVAVTYALSSSFLVAVTVVPALAFMFIRKQHLPPESESALQRRYTPVLRWVLDHRAATLAVAGILFAGSMLLMSQRPRAFIPDFGEVEINASVSLPEGTGMIETDALVMEFEERLAGLGGIETVTSEVGSAGGLQSLLLGAGVDQRAASISVRMEEPEQLDRLVGEVRQAAEATFGQEQVIVSGGTASSSAFGGFALVAAGDAQQLSEFNQRAIEALNQVEGLANVTSNLGETETILRVDGESAVRFTGELETADTLGVTEAAKADLEAIAPSGVAISEGFETRQQTQGFQQAIRSVLISILAVYLVMVITFRSFVHPFTILFSLPMAVVGAAVALWLTDRVVGIPVLVGLMMLVGIVVTNAIVLIDRVQANRVKRGMGGREALIEGGRTRLRPILMTAIAAMLALVPLALGLTEGAIIAAELATVVIGGLFTSTFLTLLIVPVIYSLLNQVTGGQRQAPTSGD